VAPSYSLLKKVGEQCHGNNDGGLCYRIKGSKKKEDQSLGFPITKDILLQLS